MEREQIEKTYERKHQITIGNSGDDIYIAENKTQLVIEGNSFHVYSCDSESRWDGQPLEAGQDYELREDAKGNPS